MKYTVFFEQVNMTNFQVTAKNEEEAERKAKKLYKACFDMPVSYVYQV